MFPSWSRHTREDTVLWLPPCCPTVDRLRRSTVGLGTREDLHTLVKYFVPALQRVHLVGACRVGELPSLAGTFEFMAPEDVFRWSRWRGVPVSTTRLRSDERPGRRGGHCSCSCSGSSCVQPVGTRGPTGDLGWCGRVLVARHHSLLPAHDFRSQWEQCHTRASSQETPRLEGVVACGSGGDRGTCDRGWCGRVLAARPHSLFAAVAYRSRQVDFAAQNNSGKECGDGSRLFHLAACGLLLWFSRSQIGGTLTRVVDTVPPSSAGRGRHLWIRWCRGGSSWSRSRHRATGSHVVQWIREGHCRRGVVGFFYVLLPGFTHLRSISSPARHWGDCWTKGCKWEALQFSSFEINIIPSSGRAGGSHCKVCGDEQSVAVWLTQTGSVFGGWGEWGPVCRSHAVAILVKYEFARNFERPPSHPALLDSVTLTGCKWEALQFSSFEINIIPSSGRAGGSHCKVCGNKDSSEEISSSPPFFAAFFVVSVCLPSFRFLLVYHFSHCFVPFLGGYVLSLCFHVLNLCKCVC